MKSFPPEKYASRVAARQHFLDLMTAGWSKAEYISEPSHYYTLQPNGRDGCCAIGAMYLAGRDKAITAWERVGEIEDRLAELNLDPYTIIRLSDDAGDWPKALANISKYFTLVDGRECRMAGLKLIPSNPHDGMDPEQEDLYSAFVEGFRQASQHRSGATFSWAFAAGQHDQVPA